MSILDDLNLPKLIGDTAGEILFSDIRIFRTQQGVSDGRGGFTRGRTIVSARGIIVEYSEFMRTVGGIPLDARKMIIQGEGLDTPPIPEDLVELDLTGWIIREVKAVPLQAVYECMVVPTALSLAAGLAALSITSAITADDATFSGSLAVASGRTLSLNQTTDDASLSSSSSNPISGTSAIAADNATLAAAVLTPIGIVAGIVADPAGLVAVTTSPLTLALNQQAENATLDARIGGASLVTFNHTADDATLVADLDNPLDVSGNNQAEDATLTASARNPIGISTAINVDNATLAASIFLPNDVVSTTAAEDATLTASIIMPLTASSAITADNSTLSAVLETPNTLQMLLDAGNATLVADTAVVDAGGPNPGEPTLASGVQIAFDPAGTSGGDYTNGLGSHSGAPYQAPIWPVNGSNDTVDSAWDGILSGTPGNGANNLVIDKADMDASGVNVANQPRTISFWYKTPDPGSDQFKTIFGQGGNWPQFGGSNQGDFGVRVDGNDLEMAFLGTFAAAAPISSPRTAYMDGTWHHIAIGISDTEKDYYFDGVRKGGTSQTGSAWEAKAINSALMWSNASAVRGTTSHDQAGGFSDSRGFDLEIGDVRIYNEKISDGDVSALFAAGRYEYNAGAHNGLLPATNAVLAAYTGTPPAGRDSAIDTLITELQTSGAWSQLDWLSVINFDDQASRINLIDPTEALVDLGIPTIVPDQYFDQFESGGSAGFQGHSSLPTEGSALGDFSFGAFWLKQDEQGVSRDIRVGDNNTWVRTDFTNPIGRMTGEQYTFSGRDHTDLPFSITMSHNDTSSADSRRFFWDGNLEGTATGTGGALSGDAEFGADNQAADSHHGAYWSGRALTDAQALALHNSISTYLTAIGAI